MPVRIIGMIGVAPPANEATVHVITGGISPEYLKAFSQAHEQAGFDMVLVGYTAASAEGFNVAQFAAAHTKRLQFLIAHRPGFMAPTLAARTVATFDHLTGGRIALHIIAGASDAEMRADGDMTTKEERYLRAEEYLEIMKGVWTASAPFSFDGQYYRIEKARSDVKPQQVPHPLIFFGGSSDGAVNMGARLCDVYALFGEPLAATETRLDEFRRAAKPHGRTPGFNISFRPIIAGTEAGAWEKARRILEEVNDTKVQQGLNNPNAKDRSGERLLQLAADGDVYDRHLWMGIARATGAVGNTTCLVGTPEQVAGAILNYYRLGVDSFLLRGFDPYRDAIAFGEALIPSIRTGVAAIDGEAGHLRTN